MQCPLKLVVSGKVHLYVGAYSGAISPYIGSQWCSVPLQWLSVVQCPHTMVGRGEVLPYIAAQW